MTHKQKSEKYPYSPEAFRAYNELFADINLRHPQRQGLLEDEYQRFVSDARVVTTPVEIEGIHFEVPQLAPIEGFEWLNTDFYRKHFPDEVTTGRLQYFTEVPRVRPDDRVFERISTLAHEGGVLAFDTPSCDPEMLGRTLAMLDALGIQYEQPQLLGTQTYFAGQSTLKRRQPAAEPILMTDAYDQAVDEGAYSPDSANGVVLQHIVDTEQAKLMYEFYDDAYQVLNDHPCKQGLSPEEFYEMVTQDPSVDKIMAMNDGRPESLYLTCNDLTKLSWTNPQYYDRMYPDTMRRGQGLWFPGIATDPRPEVAGHNSEAIVAFMADLVHRGGNNFRALFDFCDMNSSWLPGHLQDIINATEDASIDIQPIADQKYWAVRLVA